MKENWNALDEAQVPVVEAPVADAVLAVEEMDAQQAVVLGKAALSRKAAAQSPEENARFAQLRRCRRQLEQLLEEVRQLTGKQWVLAEEQPDPQLHKLEAERCLLEDPDYLEERRKALRDRRLAHLRVLEEDLRRIRQQFPQERIGCLGDLGEDFLILRENGVSPTAACAAVLGARQEICHAPEMGLMHHRQEGPKEYYTPGEVDRLTEQELRDPGVMAAVRYSMTKWKRR